MQASDIPPKITTPFATDALAGNITDPLPLTPQPNGHASYQEGFPPVNFTPVAAGGIPPWGNDVNGAHFIATSWARWQASGGPISYDATFQSTIGGYPQGARVASAAMPGVVWISTADNNLTNPDTGGAGWLQVGSFITFSFLAAGTQNVTSPNWCGVMWGRCRGGGGGGSGSNGGAGVGSSGAGGGSASGWFAVTPGHNIRCTVGAGGTAAISGASAGNGGTSSVVDTTPGPNVTLLSATGGTGGGPGPGVGGIGTVGQFLYQGQPGQDLDGLIGSGGSNMFAVGGNCADGGGLGGSVNAAGGRLAPTSPGGGGGANFFATAGQNGADGGIDLAFRVG